MKELSIEEMHTCLLDMAKYFHQICEENNIPYYMLGGTMLGAIRHKGFIPWDDDMDFGVERKYYMKLQQVLQANQNTPYRLKTIDNSQLIFNDPCKLEDTRTSGKEISREGIAEEQGLFIDIFPLDKTNGNQSFFSYNNYVHILGLINSYRYCDTKKMHFFHKFFAYIFRGVFFAVKKRFLVDFAKSYLIPHEGCYISNLYGYWGVRETISQKIMGTPTLYNFEDTYFYGPQYYDEYLSSLYGDYMQLPPEGKRHIHLTKFFIK